jgi:lipoprotein-anchoring transpeptidase ErfK/SrfK
MRVLLLCSLGALVLWFAWHSLGGTTTNAGYEPTSPGAMLPPETGEAAAATQAGESQQPVPEPPAAAQPAETKPKAEPAAVPEKAAAPVVAQPAPGPGRPAPISVVPDKLETELARSLVSSPESFCDLVAKHKDLPGPRQKFALALGRTLEGKLDEARELAGALADDALVRTSEREFLERLISGSPTTAKAAGATNESALAWAALLVAETREAERSAAEDKPRDAVRGYSSALLDYVRAPWKSDPAVLRRWSAALTKEQRKYRWNRSADWPSVAVQVSAGDSLIGVRKRVVAQHPDLLICTGQIERANELPGDTLHPGQTLRIPTDRARMLVDLDAHWAFYIVGDEVAGAWEVGIGKEGGTRPGKYVVGEKKEEPMWFRQGQAPVPYGSPENPLGTRWIAWLTADGQATGLGFHGTNQPESIGKDESQGCIRMRNTDVEELFEILPKGAAIQVQA